MNASAAIASILKAEGTEYLFCFPVNPLIDDCARLGIRPIVARTERALVNMADGYARASNGRRIGVAAVQHGPGAENAYPGVAQASAHSTPWPAWSSGRRERRRRRTASRTEAGSAPARRAGTGW